MCTFHKIVNGDKITVQFHADDLKVWHKDQAVWTNFLDELRFNLDKKMNWQGTEDSYTNT